MAKRVIIGKNNLNKYGLYISKAGRDVDTITNPEDYAFSSDWSSSAIVHFSGTINMNQTITFPALPYTPLIISFAIRSSDNQIIGRYRESSTDIYTWSTGSGGYEYEYAWLNIDGPILEARNNQIYYPNVYNLRGEPLPVYVKYYVLRIPMSI